MGSTPGRRSASPGVSHFFGEEPADGARPGGMSAGNLGVGQRNHRNRRVPDRRKARLHAHPIILSDVQIIELLHRPPHGGRIEVVIETSQRDDRIDHRRKNRPQAVGVFAMLEHPPVRRADSRPRHAAGTRRSSHLSTASTARKKFVHESHRAVRRDGRPRSLRNSSAMPRSSGSDRTGL